MRLLSLTLTTHSLIISSLIMFNGKTSPLCSNHAQAIKDNIPGTKSNYNTQCSSFHYKMQLLNFYNNSGTFDIGKDKLGLKLMMVQMLKSYLLFFFLVQQFETLIFYNLVSFWYGCINHPLWHSFNNITYLSKKKIETMISISYHQMQAFESIHLLLSSTLMKLTY